MLPKAGKTCPVSPASIRSTEPVAGAETTARSGRLNSIEMLPEEADEDIRWAAQEVAARAKPRNVIFDEFNARLADKGIASISRSAFYRNALHVAEQARDHADMREVANAITDRMEPGDTDAVTVWLAETIKVVIAKIIRLRQDGVFAPKEAKEMAEALRALVSAQNISTDRRAKLQKQVDEKVVEAINTVAKQQGLSDELAAEIREKVVGR